MTRCLWGLQAVACLLMAVPFAAGAQDARLAARLDADTRVQVEREVELARAAGLPSEPLIQKALEGASKRAPGDRIVRAVQSLASQMLTARSALGAASQESELVAGASALQTGVSAQVLTAMRSARSNGSLVVPLVTIADLVARGVPADTAAMVVQVILASGAPDSEFTQLRRDIESDIAAGAPPAAAAAIRASDFIPRTTTPTVPPIPRPPQPTAIPEMFLGQPI